MSRPHCFTCRNCGNGYVEATHPAHGKTIDQVRGPTDLCAWHARAAEKAGYWVEELEPARVTS